jgi:hypothetical protein
MNNLRTERKISVDGYDFIREGGYYRRGSTTKENPERWLHRYIWHKEKGPIPEGYIVHHKDEIKANNDISNFKLLKFEVHSSHHAKNMKTDNSFLQEKIDLRLETVNLIEKEEIKVLELFSGDGIIWSEVIKSTDKKVQILRIDQKSDKVGIYLKGDNLKFIKSMDLSVYDIIDLDAYGSPFKQLEILCEKQYKGIVHCTFIQIGMGRIDDKLLIRLGYTKSMIDQAPTLFSRNGLVKFERYLALCGINIIKGFFIERKNYFYFKFG